MARFGAPMRGRAQDEAETVSGGVLQGVEDGLRALLAALARVAFGLDFRERQTFQRAIGPHCVD